VRGGGIKEKDGRGEFSYEILWELLWMSWCTPRTTIIIKFKNKIKFKKIGKEPISKGDIQLATKYMKRWSTSLINTEMKIHAILR
jgi:hypothetical protein